MLFGGETAQSYYEEGLTASMKGDLDKAIRYFQRACELDAGLHNARHQIGRCLLRQGNAEAALPLLRAVSQKLPASTAPVLDTGYALLQLGRIDGHMLSHHDAKLTAPRRYGGLRFSRNNKPQSILSAEH